MSRKTCTHCTAWKPSMKEINDCIIVAHYTHKKSFKGEPFKFCPWCANELTEEEIEKDV